MNFSIATHFCGGEIAGVKASFSEKLADCGMKMMDEAPTSFPVVKAEGCCQNHFNILKVDNNYNPSSYQVQNADYNLLQMVSTPVILSSNYDLNNFKKYNVIPPGIALVSSVNLTDICIFRI